MNTKILMIVSSIFLVIIGIVFSFFPREIILYLDLDTNLISILFIQILGSLYLGFGILNWMAKGNLIGGIYSKPLAIGNLMHFGVSAIALIKIIFKLQTHFEIILALTIIYTFLAICFVYVFITNPQVKNSIK